MLLTNIMKSRLKLSCMGIYTRVCKYTSPQSSDLGLPCTYIYMYIYVHVHAWTCKFDCLMVGKTHFFCIWQENVCSSSPPLTWVQLSSLCHDLRWHSTQWYSWQLWVWCIISSYITASSEVTETVLTTSPAGWEGSSASWEGPTLPVHSFRLVFSWLASWWRWQGCWSWPLPCSSLLRRKQWHSATIVHGILCHWCAQETC